MSKDKESISEKKESKNILKMEKNNNSFFSKTLTKLNKKNLIISSIILVGIVAITAIVINVINEKDKKEESKICSVQFNTNGGLEIETVNLECGKAIPEPKIPEKNGFEFVGWYLNDKEFNFLSKIEKNIIIEAKWEAKEELEIVIVSFDSNGGTSVNSIEVAKGETISPPLEPTKKGYKFNGWTYENKVFDFRNPIVEKITLKATWKKVEPVNNSSGSSSQGTGNNSSNNNKYKCSGNYNKTILEKTVTIGYNDHISWTFSTGVSYSNDDCYITYKSSNSSVASISEDGKISAHKKGSTYIYECINDKTTKTEIGCFQGKLTVNNSQHEEEKEKTLAFANSINGYYWYLDGYDYAYIHTSIIDWYDHTLLKWDSKYIAIENNKFVTSEDTNIWYVSDSNINNYFLMNPTELGYDVIKNYNMKVSGSKLYITLGGKQYSFTKRTTAKADGNVSLSLSSSSLKLDENTDTTIYATLKNYFFSNNIEVTSSNSNVAYCSEYSTYGAKITFNCYAKSPGTANITIKDTVGGASKTLNITVNDVVIPVTGITIDKSSLNLERGNSTTLKLTVSPTIADNKSVLWSSSDTSIVAVNSSGKITAIKKGTATITATSIDGGYTAKCVVTVSNPPLTVKGSIGIQTTVSSSGATRGVHAEINASGGTGSYTYYYIKVYKDGTLIGSTTNTTSNELFIVGHTNGSYTMEYEVRDSDGTIKTGTSTSTISGF